MTRRPAKLMYGGPLAFINNEALISYNEWELRGKACMNTGCIHSELRLVIMFGCSASHIIVARDIFTMIV
jgi:hypothetical protein